MPFDAKNKDELFKQIQGGDFTKGETWQVVSLDGKKFVQDCLNINQDERPKPAELLSYKWITDLKTKKLESQKVVQFEV